MKRTTAIKKAIKALDLETEFPHKHWEGCYSYDGHRSDLDCNEFVTPDVCNRCDGTGRSITWGGPCSRCQSTGVMGGNEQARNRIISYIEHHLDVDEMLK